MLPCVPNISTLVGHVSSTIHLFCVRAAKWLNSEHDYWNEKAVQRFAIGRSGIAMYLHLQWS